MKRLALGFVVLLLIAGAGLAVYVYPSSRATAAPGVQPIAGNGPARILLNEILFQPSPGQSSFVELVNAGGEPAKLDGIALMNQAGERYALPAAVTLPAGGLLLVRFDGTGQVDGTTLHAPHPGFLQRETGSLALLNGADTIDDALWSTAGGPSFNLGRGGHIPAFVAAATLGRPRDSIGRGPAAWTVFDPGDATPGAPNAFPAVTGLLPLPGAIVRAATLTLSWYGVPTASRYRIQVATDRSFASPVFDSTSAASGPGLASEQITTPALSPGRYFWRVQAIFGADSRSAAFSRPAILWLEATPRTAGLAPLRDWLKLFVAPALAAAPARTALVRKILPVPLILQHKDTPLLSIEADETGEKRWDAPWPLATGPYCGRASVAMVAARFGGRLSQDRITHQAFKDFRAGPIFDIYTGNGYGDRDIFKSLTYALGSEPSKRFNETATAQEYFDFHRAEIDAGFPVVSTTAVHVFVVVGYGEDERGKYLTVNDPAIGQYDWLVVVAPGVADADQDSPAGTGHPSTSFLIPRNARGVSDEPTVHQDSDGDGVMDFDETERFGTNPLSKDSDNDGVGDKEEIRAWVYKETGGWARVNPTGQVISDADGDGKAMQMDADSDGGGCFDGMEDTNRNGKYESAQQESDNFDGDDDHCVTGSYRFVSDITRTDTAAQRSTVLIAVEFSAREPEDTHRGRAIVTFSQRNEFHGPGGDCVSSMVHKTDPYEYSTDVTVDVAQAADQTVQVIVKTPAGFSPPPARFVTTCPEISPFESPGPDVGIAGILRNGVYDDRTDWPLSQGETGTQWTETHIRMRSARRQVRE